MHEEVMASSHQTLTINASFNPVSGLDLTDDDLEDLFDGYPPAEDNDSVESCFPIDDHGLLDSFNDYLPIEDHGLVD